MLEQLEPETGQPSAQAHATPIPSASRNARPAIGLDEPEMEFRNDLHSLGADLGEDIEITKGPSDRLVVNATGASPQIKEGLAALLANRPGE